MSVKQIMNREQKTRMIISKKPLEYIILLLFLLGMIVINFSISFSQSINWSEPKPISSIEEIGWNPAIVSDSSGVVHLIWTSDKSGIGGNRGDVIMYAKWSEGDWSNPISILSSPDNEGTSTPSISLDSFGWLHIIWSGGGTFNRGPLYYSRSPVLLAGSAKSWSKPELLAENVFWGNVKVDNKDQVVVVYADDDKEAIMITKKPDLNSSWSKPISVGDVELRNDLDHLTRPRLTIGPLNDYHLVWAVDNFFSERPYSGKALYYSHSRDEGTTWSESILIDSIYNPLYSNKTPSEWIDVAVDSADRVHLIWDGVSGYRYHQWSSDGGKSWTLPEIFLDKIGYNGWNAMTLDKNNNLHVVSSTVSGVFYCFWENGKWIRQELFPVIGSPHYGTMIINRGNTLFYVYQNNVGRDLQGSFVGVVFQTLQLPLSEASISPVPTVVLSKSESSLPKEKVLTPTYLIKTLNQSKIFDSRSAELTTSDEIIGLSIFPVIILLVVIYFIKITKNRK